MHKLTKELCDKWSENKNINPITLKKIKDTGLIYKTLKSKCYKIVNNFKLTKTICDKWNENKKINPITLRKIKNTGNTYKQLEKKCSLNQNNAALKIQKIFTPFIKRISSNIIDRINFFIIIR